VALTALEYLEKEVLELAKEEELITEQQGSCCAMNICPSIEKLPPEKPVTHNTTITIVHT